jgi:hypothetical protein
MLITLNGLYLSRNARRVGIVRDRGADKYWRWVTTRGYYVTAEGRACRVGESSHDLVADITPEIRPEHVDAVDSMVGDEP